MLHLETGITKLAKIKSDIRVGLEVQGVQQEN